MHQLTTDIKTFDHTKTKTDIAHIYLVTVFY